MFSCKGICRHEAELLWQLGCLRSQRWPALLHNSWPLLSTDVPCYSCAAKHLEVNADWLQTWNFWGSLYGLKKSFRLDRFFWTEQTANAFLSIPSSNKNVTWILSNLKGSNPGTYCRTERAATSIIFQFPAIPGSRTDLSRDLQVATQLKYIAAGKAGEALCSLQHVLQTNIHFTNTILSCNKPQGLQLKVFERWHTPASKSGLSNPNERTSKTTNIQ